MITDSTFPLDRFVRPPQLRTGHIVHRTTPDGELIRAQHDLPASPLWARTHSAGDDPILDLRPLDEPLHQGRVGAITYYRGSPLGPLSDTERFIWSTIAVGRDEFVGARFRVHQTLSSAGLSNIAHIPEGTDHLLRYLLGDDTLTTTHHPLVEKPLQHLLFRHVRKQAIVALSGLPRNPHTISALIADRLQHTLTEASAGRITVRDNSFCYTVLLPPAAEATA